MRFIRAWVIRQLEKERCGVWPFQLPWWFPFTGCCMLHDVAYTTIRMEALDMLEHLQEGAAVERYLEEFYKHRVLQADRMFILCMHTNANKLTAPFARMFSRIIEEAGWRVWLRGTLRIWDAMDHSGGSVA